LKDAAKELSINYSTAKTILRIFRIEKRIEKKNADEERVLKQLISDFKKDRRSSFGDLEEIQEENVNVNVNVNLNGAYVNIIPQEISTSMNSPEVRPRSLQEKSQAARLSLFTNLAVNNRDSRESSSTLMQKNCHAQVNPIKISSNNDTDLSSLEMKLKILENDQERFFTFHQILSIYQNNIKSFSDQIYSNQMILSSLMQVAEKLKINTDFNFNTIGKNKKINYNYFHFCNNINF
jgi:hypothetical protein